MQIESKHLLITIKELTDLYLESLPNTKDGLAKWDPNFEDDVEHKNSILDKIEIMEPSAKALNKQARIELENIKH